MIYGNFGSLDQGMRACATDTRCGSVYDPKCNNRGIFYLCPKGTIRYLYGDCAHEKQGNQHWPTCSAHPNCLYLNLLIWSNNLSPLVFNCGNWPPLNPIWGCAGGPDAVNLDRSLDYNDPVQRKRCVELCLKHMATDQDKYGCCFLMGSGGSGCYYKARSTADPGIGNGISISCRIGKIKLEMFDWSRIFKLTLS